MGMSQTNPKPKTRSRKTTRNVDPIDELVQELALAIRLDRAALLFVIVASRATRERAQKKLSDALQATGQHIQFLDASEIDDGDIPMAIRNARERGKKIFFVSNLRAGGDATLRALNMRREYFSELRARVVFWLTPTEEKLLARDATDFWMFRQRTIYLSSEKTS